MPIRPDFSGAHGAGTSYQPVPEGWAFCVACGAGACFVAVSVGWAEKKAPSCSRRRILGGVRPLQHRFIGGRVGGKGGMAAGGCEGGKGRMGGREEGGRDGGEGGEEIRERQ